MSIVNFKGFDDWVEIFAGGSQTDSKGREHDGDAAIEKAVATFDPAFHEPPAVVGHPRHNDPAYGWVQAVKAEERGGKKVMLAKFKDVDPDFAEMVRAGRFPKRSVSFYPDGSLRHVGFLGAAPPAVKGLKNISFNDADGITFEFADAPRSWTWGAIARTFRSLRDYFIEKEGAERADQIVPEWNIEDVTEEQRRAAETINQEGDTMSSFAEFLEAFKFWKKLEANPNAQVLHNANAGTALFSEEEVKQREAKAAEDAKKKANAEFAEEKRKEAKKQRDKDIAAWVSGKVDDGVIPPAIADTGLAAFMQGLDDAPIEFSEGGEKKSPVDWMKNFIDELGESPLFAEIATKGSAAARQSDAEAEVKLGREIAAKIK